jgi:hypothetical protein
VPLKIINSPYRDVSNPLLDYLRDIRRESPRDLICVFIPEYVVGRWWEHLLHNHSALRLKTRLLFTPGVMVTSVPYHLTSSHSQLSGEDQVSPTSTGRRAPVSAGATGSTHPS